MLRLRLSSCHATADSHATLMGSSRRGPSEYGQHAHFTNEECSKVYVSLSGAKCLTEEQWRGTVYVSVRVIEPHHVKLFHSIAQNPAAISVKMSLSSHPVK